MPLLKLFVLQCFAGTVKASSTCPPVSAHTHLYHIHVHLHACIYVRMRACSYTHTYWYICAYISVCMDVCMFICMYVCMYICICARWFAVFRVHSQDLSPCKRASTHMCTHTYIHRCTHTHTHVVLQCAQGTYSATNNSLSCATVRARASFIIFMYWHIII
jgi:hypothetical protein